jgi:hypothetical protein
VPRLRLTWTRRRRRSWPTPRSLGIGGSRRRDQRTSLEDQAELVSGGHRGPRPAARRSALPSIANGPSACSTK